MSMYRYSSKVLNHFWSARNAGEVAAPDGVGTAEGGGVSMRITIRVEQDRIADARFRCSSCLVAVACCSQLTELARQMTLEQAVNFAPDRLALELGEIPEERMDRCELAVAALENAVRDYRSKKQKPEGVDR